MPHFHLLRTDPTESQLPILHKLIRRQHLQNPRPPSCRSRNPMEGSLVCSNGFCVQKSPRVSGETVRRRTANAVGSILDREDDSMHFPEFHLSKRHQPAHGRSQCLAGKCCARWKSTIHQRVQTPSNRHVVCHRQCRRKLLLNEQVQHRVGMWLGPIEHVLPEHLGRVQSFEILRVRITDGLE